MYYSSGNYEAFATPKKPEGIDGKSAYIVGTGLAGLAAACFILGVLLYSTVVRAEYPDIGSNFFPAVLSVALVFWIGARMRSRKSQLPE